LAFKEPFGEGGGLLCVLAPVWRSCSPTRALRKIKILDKIVIIALSNVSILLDHFVLDVASVLCGFEPPEKSCQSQSKDDDFTISHRSNDSSGN
jgi:hypothetical protein